MLKCTSLKKKNANLVIGSYLDIEKEWKEQMKKDKALGLEENVPKLVKYTSQDDAVALGGSRKETHPLYEGLENVEEESQGKAKE